MKIEDEPGRKGCIEKPPDECIYTLHRPIVKSHKRLKVGCEFTPVVCASACVMSAFSVDHSIPEKPMIRPDAEIGQVELSAGG